MGSCLSTHKSDAGSDQVGINRQDPVQQPHQPQEYPDLFGQTGISTRSHGSRRHHHRQNVPLDARYDRALKRTVWTHDEDKDGPRPTLRQLEAMRDEFWHTRVTGREEIWHIIRQVIELLMADPSDDALETAQEMLKASEITVPSGDLSNSVYDVFGNRYKFPRSIISNPTNLREESIARSSSEAGRSIHTSSSYKSSLGDEEAHRRRVLKGKAPAFGSEMKVPTEPAVLKTAIFRTSDFTDYRVDFWTNEPLGDLTLRLMDMAKIDSNDSRVKIALHGQILYMNRTLLSQGWSEQLIVSVFVQHYHHIGKYPGRTSTGSLLPTPVTPTMPRVDFPIRISPPALPALPTGGPLGLSPEETRLHLERAHAFDQAQRQRTSSQLEARHSRRNSQSQVQQSQNRENDDPGNARPRKGLGDENKA